jgi:hypothetical protein
MAAALATIFGFEKSRKWIIRDGVTGISRSGSGAPIACGWKKSLGCLKLLLLPFLCARSVFDVNGEETALWNLAAAADARMFEVRRAQKAGR